MLALLPVYVAHFNWKKEKLIFPKLRFHRGDIEKLHFSSYAYFNIPGRFMPLHSPVNWCTLPYSIDSFLFAFSKCYIFPIGLFVLPRVYLRFYSIAKMCAAATVDAPSRIWHLFTIPRQGKETFITPDRVRVTESHALVHVVVGIFNSFVVSIPCKWFVFICRL